MMTKPYPFYEKHATKPNTLIIIMSIRKLEAAQIGGLKVDVER